MKVTKPYNQPEEVMQYNKIRTNDQNAYYLEHNHCSRITSNTYDVELYSVVDTQPLSALDAKIKQQRKAVAAFRKNNHIRTMARLYGRWYGYY